MLSINSILLIQIFSLFFSICILLTSKFDFLAIQSKSICIGYTFLIFAKRIKPFSIFFLSNRSFRIRSRFRILTFITLIGSGIRFILIAFSFHSRCNTFILIQHGLIRLIHGIQILHGKLGICTKSKSFQFISGNTNLDRFGSSTATGNIQSIIQKIRSIIIAMDLLQNIGSGIDVFDINTSRTLEKHSNELSILNLEVLRNRKQIFLRNGRRCNHRKLHDVVTRHLCNRSFIGCDSLDKFSTFANSIRTQFNSGIIPIKDERFGDTVFDITNTMNDTSVHS